MSTATYLPPEPSAQDAPPRARVRATAPHILVALAWLGRVSSQHIQHLIMPQYHLKRVSDVMTELRQQKLVERYLHYVDASPRSGSPCRTPPKLDSAWWSLTPRGWDLIREHGRAPHPDTYKPPRSLYFFEHDRLVTDTLVTLIRLAQGHGGCGVYVAREMRVDREQPRPIMDAVIRLHLREAPSTPGRIPWGHAVPQDSTRARVYGVEADNDSEDLRTISDKAVTYHHVNTREWRDRHGMDFPIVLWMAPDDARRAAIDVTWQRAWEAYRDAMLGRDPSWQPDKAQGRWWSGSLLGMAQDRWVRYDRGVREERGLFGYGEPSP